jgi:hypothetical protein
MPKKVVIGDLVVQVGVDTKGTTRQLKNLENQIGRTQKRTNKESRAGLKTATRRTAEAKAQAKQAKEAARVERNRLKALQRSDAIRRRVGAAEDRREQRRRAQELRHQRQVSRARTRQYNSFVRGGRNVTGSLMTGATMGVLGVGGIAAASTAKAVQKSRGYRVSEQLYHSGLEARGDTPEQARIKKKDTLGQAAYYNLNATDLMKEIGSGLYSMSSVESGTVQSIIKSLSIFGSSLGLTRDEKQRGLAGLSQFTTAQTSENLNQIVENMRPLMPLIAKSLNLSESDFKKHKQGGTLAQAVESRGGMQQFLSALNTQIEGVALPMFDKNKGKLPESLDRLESIIDRLIILFGTSGEGGVIDFVQNLSLILEKNQKTIVAAGEWMGTALSSLSTSLSETMKDLQPIINKWVESWNSMSDLDKENSVADTFTSIADALKTIFLAWLAFKAAENPKGAAAALAVLGGNSTINPNTQNTVDGVNRFLFPEAMSNLLNSRFGADNANGNFRFFQSGQEMHEQMKIRQSMMNGPQLPTFDNRGIIVPAPIVNVNIETRDPDTSVESTLINSQPN